MEMDVFAKAAGSMAGDSDKSDTDITVDVIDAAIQLLQSEDIVDTTHRLQRLRECACDGNLSRDKIRSITNCVLDNEVDEKPIEATHLQLLRFHETYPVLYEEYQVGRNKRATHNILRKVVNKYPEPPHNHYIVYDAIGAAAFWSNYKMMWEIFGHKTGDAIAWAYDASTLYLLHFVNNVLCAGIVLPVLVAKRLIPMWENRESIIVEDYNNGETQFEISINKDNEYDFRVDGYTVMSVDEAMMLNLYQTVKGCNITPNNYINARVSYLVRG